MTHKNTSLSIQAFVVFIGILFSSFLSWFFYLEEEKIIASEFRKDVDQRAASIYQDIALNFEALRSLAILFNGSRNPEWDTFSIEAAKIMSRHKNIQALEWIPRVANAERSIFEHKQRQKFPDFVISERQDQGKMVSAGEREEYFPVYYVEPLMGNEAAFGFDLASNNTRLETLRKARDTAKPQATASVTLVQEQRKEKGFLAFLPIYRGIPTTLDARQANLKGFVLGVYRIRDIFNQSTQYSNASTGIQFELTDETDPVLTDILHSHKPETSAPVYQRINYKKPLPDVWGRQWMLTAQPTNNYISVRRTALPLAILISGLLFTVFITVYVNIITRRSITIQKEVKLRTEELTKANNKLSQLSRTDGLTGLANRRYFDEDLTKEWLRAIRNKTTLSIVIVDIDYFKGYNDNYGHLSGDDCIKRVANKLKEQVSRPGDLVARYGGEEFALILPNTEHANVVASKCQQAIEAMQIPHGFSDTSRFISISVGYCTVEPKTVGSQHLAVKAADTALYKAKDAGRNQVKGGVFLEQ